MFVYKIIEIVSSDFDMIYMAFKFGNRKPHSGPKVNICLLHCQPQLVWLFEHLTQLNCSTTSQFVDSTFIKLPNILSLQISANKVTNTLL